MCPYKFQMNIVTQINCMILTGDVNTNYKILLTTVMRCGLYPAKPLLRFCQNFLLF